jgi:hypothetical protein
MLQKKRELALAHVLIAKAIRHVTGLPSESPDIPEALHASSLEYLAELKKTLSGQQETMPAGAVHNGFHTAIEMVIDRAAGLLDEETIDPPEARALIGILWFGATFGQSFADTVERLFADERDRLRGFTAEGLFDYACEHGPARTRELDGLMQDLDALAPMHNRDFAIDVQAAGAILLSVGYGLSAKFVSALCAAALLDTHPQAKNPERVSYMRHLIEGAMAQLNGDARRIVFSNEGVAGAFARAASEGRNGLINL